MRLVDLDALLNELNTKAPDDSSGFDHDVWLRDGYDFAVDVVKEAPTIDPVKHGKWERLNTAQYDGFRCSCCGKFVFGDQWNYCPNCGARMDK